MIDITWTLPLIVMASVIGVSILAWVLRPVKNALILHPYSVWRGQVHRLLTSGWLHADTTHLVFNLITLWFFTRPVVTRLGEGRFLLLYLTAVVVANIPTTIRYKNRPEYHSLGASGAVCAVMFSAILLDPKIKVGIIFLPVAVPGIVYAPLYLAYSVIQSIRARGSTNHDAHFTGAVWGALLTFFMEPARVEATLHRLLG